MAAAALASPTRSLLPKEHGAYAQLGLPLLAGLAMGRPGLVSGALVVAFVAALLAHEPLLVLLGQRGRRAASEAGGRARRRLTQLGLLAVSSMALAISLGGPAVQGALVVCVTLGAVTGIFTFYAMERTWLGEHLAAMTLSSALLPIALAGAVPLRQAVFAWAAFGLGFFAAVSAVRGTIATKKRGASRIERLLPVSGAAAVALVGPLLGIFPAWSSLAALPMLSGALYLATFPPPPRALMRVGWTLAATGLATALLVIVRH